MPVTLLRQIRHLATGRNVVVLLLIFLLFNVLIIPPDIAHFQAISQGAGLLDMLDSYTPDQLYTHLTKFDAAGRQLYILHELTLDVLYPLISALLFSLSSAYLLKRALPTTSPLHALALIPFFVLIMDYLENISLVIVMVVYPARVDGLAQAAKLFTVSKWLGSDAELLLIVGSLMAFVVHQTRKIVVTMRILPEGKR